MKLIKPKQISGEIMTLLDEAEQKIIIVSPYVQVSKWLKMKNVFNQVKEREVEVEFYFREGEQKTKEEILKLDFAPIPINRLHAKFFMNESYGIISSMNLLSSSDIGSLDIAYKTETKKEYKELKEFYKKYINKKLDKVLSIEEVIDSIEENICEKFGSNSYGKIKNQEIIFQHRGNRYHFYFDEKELGLMGILSKSEYDWAKLAFEIFHNQSLNYELHEGGEGFYSTVRVKLDLKSKSFESFFSSDLDEVNKSIVLFFNKVDEIKMKVV